MSEARKTRSADPVIPDKLYFRIGEVARLLAVEPHTLRFWESEFPQLRVNKGGTGQRLYRRRDVEAALEIKHLLYEQGYTIPGARQLLQGRTRRKEAPPELPFPQATNAPGTAKHTGLARLRNDLRELSSMLARPVATAGNRSTTRAPLHARRGLHLASRSARPEHDSRDLFGPRSD